MLCSATSGTGCLESLQGTTKYCRDGDHQGILEWKVPPSQKAWSQTHVMGFLQDNDPKPTQLTHPIMAQN